MVLTMEGVFVALVVIVLTLGALAAQLGVELYRSRRRAAALAPAHDRPEQRPLAIAPEKPACVSRARPARRALARAE
jgi:hypothetical protein